LRPDELVAICPARLVPVKGIQEFFAAITPELLKGWKVLIVGEGPLKSTIQGQLERDSFTPFVLFESFVPYEEMPTLYALADLLLLPSVYDNNPLSVVEAMHSGLPLLLSDRVGNFPEALNEGVNGWGFNPGVQMEIRQAAEKAFGSTHQQLRLLGENSRERARALWNTERSIQGFLAAIGVE
jgi:glycosyltransferase involved in cell wall biosynthesis